MKTRLKFLTDPTIKAISWADLFLIIEGSAYEIQKKVDDWPKQPLT